MNDKISELGKLFSIIGGVMTAVTFNQLVGLIIGVGGLSATWWMNVMRNRREAERRKEERDEHELRMRQIIYTPERRTRSEDEL